MAKCVCCLEESDEAIIGAPPRCSKCGVLLNNYFDALKVHEDFWLEMRGYDPTKINRDVEPELRDELQEINNALEKLALEAQRIQIMVYNAGQTTLHNGEITKR